MGHGTVHSRGVGDINPKKLFLFTRKNGTRHNYLADHIGRGQDNEAEPVPKKTIFKNELFWSAIWFAKTNKFLALREVRPNLGSFRAKIFQYAFSFLTR